MSESPVTPTRSEVDEPRANGQGFRPEHFINRELSWLEFNGRVLEEAQDTSNPLLERVKFLGIFSSNLDEFFMVRVAGLREQAFGAGVAQDVPPDGPSALQQLRRIASRTQELVAAQTSCWKDSIRPSLAEHGIRILRMDELDRSHRKVVDEFFYERAFPVLTPMAIDPSHPSPRFHNRGLYIAAMLERTRGLGPSQLFAVVQVPQVLNRFVRVDGGKECDFVLLEDVVASRLSELFGGYDIVDHAVFRLTRDMDIELLEQESDDILRLIEARLRARRRSEAVRLEVAAGINPALLEMLVEEEGIRRGMRDDLQGYNEVYEFESMLDMTALFELPKLKGFNELRDPPLSPIQPLGTGPTHDLFAEISERDILLHHPFDSFNPVVDFIERAARDPDVLAIKQTLYRTSGDSPIVRALMEAAENGKHVTALVELKARFDEANNVIWARQMERAGVHVVFGFLDLKTHCKMCLVVRQEGGTLRRYVHLSTGNYNPITAKIYTDIGLFTSDPVIANDATALFNLLTGYSQNYRWEKLVVAPQDLRERTIELIDEQAALARSGKPARIFAKLNALVDSKTIKALYRASQAGVRIDLVVRGVCCLRPGMQGVSENIHVRSIVDRFLEHSRVIVFGEGKRAKVFLSSADWMPRNFDRRVEVMFPVEDGSLRERILDDIVVTYLRENARARILMPDGKYVRAKPARGESVHRAQPELLQLRLAESRSDEAVGFAPRGEDLADNGRKQKSRNRNKRLK